MFSVRRFWKVFRPPHEICRYTTIKHRADVSNPKNNQRSVCKVLSLPSLSLSLSLRVFFSSRNYISSCIVREVPVHGPMHVHTVFFGLRDFGPIVYHALVCLACCTSVVAIRSI